MQIHAYYWLSNNFRSENIPISCKHIFEKADSQGWFKIIDLPERKCLFMIITQLFWAMERMNHSDIHYKFCNKWDYCWFFYIHCLKGKLGLYLPRLYCNVRNPLWMIMLCLTEYNFFKYLWMSMCCLCNGRINMLFFKSVDKWGEKRRTI